jgi:hypothetical protein
MRKPNYTSEAAIAVVFLVMSLGKWFKHLLFSLFLLLHRLSFSDNGGLQHSGISQCKSINGCRDDVGPQALWHLIIVTSSSGSTIYQKLNIFQLKNNENRAIPWVVLKTVS